MMLQSHRYGLVLLKKINGQPLTLSPLGHGSMTAVARALTSQKPPLEAPWETKSEACKSILNTPSYTPPANWSELENSATELAWEHTHPPVTADEKIYLEGLKDLKAAVVEIFHPIWRTGNIGAGRNAIVGPLHLKGVGRTLPVNYLEHLMASGTMLPKESVHSFFISQLLETTFPLENTLGLGVLLTPSGGSLFLRGCVVPRLAQLGPDIDERERTQLLSTLRDSHGTDNISWIIRRIMGQYASLAVLGGVCHETPDNYLYTGGLIDEEDWAWPLGKTNWNFLFDAEETTSETDPMKIPWRTLRNFRSTFDYHEKIRAHVLKGLSYLCDHNVTVETAHEWFLEHIEALTGERKFWEFGEKCKSNSSAWLSELSRRDFQFLIIKDRPPGRISLRMSAPGLRLFQQQSWDLKIKAALEGQVDSFTLSRAILSQASRLGFVLPTVPDEKGVPVENSLTLKEYLRKEELRLGPWYSRVKKLIVRNPEGDEQKLSLDSQLDRNVIPLSFLIHFDDRGEMELPAKKIIIKPG